MPRKIRATFSDDRTVNVDLPKDWSELTQDELREVYQAMALFPDEDIRWHGLRVLCNLTRSGRTAVNGSCYFYILVGEPDGGTTTRVARLNGAMIAGWLSELDWMLESGIKPVRLDRLRGVDAINAQLHGVAFGDYLKLENLYQGFIYSKNPDALSRAMSILYPSETEAWEELTPMEVCNCLAWLSALKGLFSAQWSNLFRPSTAKEPNMLEVMNAEIRLLTGGDVTKEQQVLDTDCWRALTELDYKAKEAEDFKRKQRKIRR